MVELITARLSPGWAALLSPGPGETITLMMVVCVFLMVRAGCCCVTGDYDLIYNVGVVVAITKC